MYHDTESFVDQYEYERHQNEKQALKKSTLNFKNNFRHRCANEAYEVGVRMVDDVLLPLKQLMEGWASANLRIKITTSPGR